MKNIVDYLHAEYNYGVFPLITEEYLVEEHGYVPDFDKYVEAFGKALPKKWKNKTILKITDKDFSGINKFFSNITVNVEVYRTRDKDYNFQGGYVADDEDYIDSRKRLNSPVINLRFETGDGSIINKYLRYEFAHELTHMYENYRRKLNFKDSLATFADKGTYATVVGDFGTYRPEKIKRLLRQFLYWIDPMEQNAHIGCIKAEIQDSVTNSSQISNSRKAFDIVQNTESFRELKMISSFVVYLKKGTVTAEEKEEMLQYYLELFPDSNLNTYEKLYRWIVRTWDKYKVRIKRGISKIAYDVFTSSYKSTVDFKLENSDEFWEN